MLSDSDVRNLALLGLASLAAACGGSPVEQDVTLRLTRGREVVHASGTITQDPTTGRPSLVTRFALDAGKTGTLMIHSDPPTVGLYEEWRGDRRLFAGAVVDESFVGRLTDARVGARIEFAFTVQDFDTGAALDVRGAATVIEVRGAPGPAPSGGGGGVVVVVEDDGYDDTYDEPSGCESYEPEPEPLPDEEEDTWESDSSGGGCGGIEGDTVEDDWDEEQEWESDEWETDDDYESSDDDSAAGCEGDTYEASASLERRRTRRIVRGAWLMLWPIGVIAFVNRWARRRC